MMDQNSRHLLAELLSNASSEIIETARQRGWYDDGGPSDGERIALIHSELSEALEWM